MLEVAPLPAPWVQGTWGKGLPIPTLEVSLMSFLPCLLLQQICKKGISEVVRGNQPPTPSVEVTDFTGLWLDPSSSENCRILKPSPNTSLPE